MYSRIDQASESHSSKQTQPLESSGVTDSPRSDALVQQKLQSMANESAQVDRLQAYQLMANAHSEKQEVAQLQQLANGSDAVMQLKAIRGGGYLKGTVNYETQVNNGTDSAFLMQARNIQLKNPAVAGLAGDHAPTEEPPGWTGIQGLGLTNRAPHYKRMHLLNGELGGSGADVENLAPGSTDLNNTHYQKVESTLQNHVYNGGTILSYNVWAFYRTSGLDRMSNATKNIYKSSLHSIRCEYELAGTNTIQRFDITEGKKTAQAWPN